MKRGADHRDEDNIGESLRRCTFLGREVAVFCETILLKKCVFEEKQMSLIRRKTTSGENLLSLSKRCTPFQF